MRAWLPVVLTLPFALVGCPALQSDWTIRGSGAVDAGMGAQSNGGGGSGGRSGASGGGGNNATGGGTATGGTTSTDGATNSGGGTGVGGATSGSDGGIVGACESGRYTGSFSGLYSSGLTFVGTPIPAAGNLELTLAPSADGEFFTITGGTLCGLLNGDFPFSADISGTLDCTKLELVNGELSNGSYWLGIVIGPPAGTFNGPFVATYDKVKHSFTGTWKVYEPGMANPEPIYGGNGPWSANLGGTISQAGCAPGAGAAP